MDASFGVAQFIAYLCNAKVHFFLKHNKVAGCLYAGVILRAFVAEIALKDLLQKIKGEDSYEHIHDLHKLFCALDSAVQTDIDAQFQIVRKWRLPFGPQDESTVEDVLKEHKDDFVKWRYIQFSSTPEADTKLLNLEPAIEAIILFTDIFTRAKREADIIRDPKSA